MITHREIRIRAAKSQDWMAVMSGTSVPTVRLFELAGPDAVTVPSKRAALERLYSSLVVGTPDADRATASKFAVGSDVSSENADKISQSEEGHSPSPASK